MKKGKKKVFPHGPGRGWLDQYNVSNVLQQKVVFKYDVFGNRIEKDVTVGSTTTTARFVVDGWNPDEISTSSTAPSSQRLHHERLLDQAHLARLVLADGRMFPGLCPGDLAGAWPRTTFF
jgi:hypothetical protein